MNLPVYLRKLPISEPSKIRLYVWTLKISAAWIDFMTKRQRIQDRLTIEKATALLGECCLLNEGLAMSLEEQVSHLIRTARIEALQLFRDQLKEIADSWPSEAAIHPVSTHAEARVAMEELNESLIAQIERLDLRIEQIERCSR